MKRLLVKILRRLGIRVFRERKGYHYVPVVYGKNSAKLRDIRENAAFYGVARAVVNGGRTSLFYDRLYHLYQGLWGAVAATRQNEYVRIADLGTFKGGSTFFLAMLAERWAPGRTTIWTVDTFEGYHATDLPEGKEGEYLTPGKGNGVDFEEVRRYLSAFPFVRVLKGRIQERAAEFAQERFHFVHADMNLYAPTKFALEFFGARMERGGVMIADDYEARTCPGVQKAVDEYAAKRKDVRRFGLMTGQCLLLFP